MFKFNWLDVLDSGPIYTETLFEINKKEPRLWFETLNTWSNFAFLFVVCFFCYKMIKSKVFPQIFILCLPFLFIGFIGGILYHGTRSLDFWYFLDFLPIVIISQIIAQYFWIKLTKPVLGAFVIVCCQLIFLLYKNMVGVPVSWAGTFFYAPFFFNITAPMFFFYKQMLSDQKKYTQYALASVALAILSRQIDSHVGFRGTHFLWHLFGAASTFFLCECIWRQEVKVKYRLSS